MRPGTDGGWEKVWYTVNHEQHCYSPHTLLSVLQPYWLGLWEFEPYGRLESAVSCKETKKGDVERRTRYSVLLCKAVVCQHLEYCMWPESCVARKTEQEEAQRRTTGLWSEPFPRTGLSILTWADSGLSHPAARPKPSQSTRAGVGQTEGTSLTSHSTELFITN